MLDKTSQFLKSLIEILEQDFYIKKNKYPNINIQFPNLTKKLYTKELSI